MYCEPFLQNGHGNSDSKNKTKKPPNKPQNKMVTCSALLCPTLKCHIQFSRSSIASLLMQSAAELLLLFGSYFCSAGQSWGQKTQPRRLFQTGSAAASGMRPRYRPLPWEMLHWLEKEEDTNLGFFYAEHDCQNDNNLVSICYDATAAGFTDSAKRCNTATASLRPAFCSSSVALGISTLRSFCLHIRVHVHRRRSSASKS